MPRTIFISHGSPTLVIDDVPAHHFLVKLGLTMPRPRLIVMVSAHNIYQQNTVGITAQWQEWHDFGGFPDELYQMQYRPAGDPAFARELAQTLAAAGLHIAATEETALDHGAWVPLKLMYPAADVPVVTISLAQNMDNATHLALGAALAKILPDDVLLIGSGSITHNLRDAFTRMRSATEQFEVEEYAAEFIAATDVAANNTYSIADWQQWNQAGSAHELPNAKRAHPTPEHFLPLLVARAAAGEVVDAKTLHHSVELGVLGMDVIEFSPRSAH